MTGAGAGAGVRGWAEAPRAASPAFSRLNEDWNADPNAPEPEVTVAGDEVTVSFLLNADLYPQFAEGDAAVLRFSGCSRWRLGPTNDEGWYLGQCRYTGVAPTWGEFYEIAGPDPARDSPADWRRIGPDSDGARHFLFYFRDETFECMAAAWALEGPQGFRVEDREPDAGTGEG